MLPFLLGAARPGMRVHEDVGAFLTRGGAVGLGEEAGGPFGSVVGGGGGGEREFGGPYLGLGNVLGEVYGKGSLVLGQLCP